MATLERTKSFLQARENFSEKNYKEEYEASQRELNILKTKVETNSKKMEDYKLSMENKIYLLTEEHKAEKESFEKLKQEYEGHITSMENILQFQENEQAKLQQCLDDTEDDASNYLDQIDDLKKQLEELNKDVDNLHAENHKLFDMTAQLQDENVRLQNELNESEESLELHKQQVRSKLASTLEEFQQQMTEGNAKSSQKDLTIFQLNEELERVAAENVHLRISVAALNDQVGSLEALLVEQERDHLRIKTLHSSNEFNISRLSSKYESVQQQLDLKSRSSDAAESKAEKLEAQLATANAELANSKERVKELESQLKDVQAKSITDRTNLSNKLLTALDDWNDRIAFVNNQLVQKDETIASQKKQLAAKLSELYNVRQELNKLKNASNGSTTVTPIGSPSKGGGADVSDQDTPTVAVPQRQMSNTWTQLKNQLADYQLSSPAATAGGVATQFIPPTPPKPSSSSSSSSGASSSHAASREIKRSPSSKWTLNGLNNGQPARAPSALEEESALPPPPVPRYALSRSACAASTSSASLHTPTKSAATSAAASSVAASAAATVSPAPAAVATAAMASPSPSSAAASSPAAPHSSMGASVTVTNSSRPQLHKAQSVILNPRATSPSRNKSPERTRSTMNLSGTSNAGSGSYTAASNYMNRSMGAGAAAAAEARAKSPARLSKSASMGTDKFR